MLCFHGLAKLILDFLLQEGVDECLQFHVRGWLLVKDDVVVVHVPDAFELGASLNLGRIECVEDVVFWDFFHSC